MKLGVGRRILMFLHWLVSLIIIAAFAAYLIAPEFVTRLYEGAEASIGETGMKAAGIVLLAIYVALAVFQAILIFRRKKRVERGFIDVNSGDGGQVRIAVSAVEQLVRQSVHNIDGIADMKIDITSDDDAINIVVNAVIVSGSHVPTITMNMQRSIRQFVELNCGVAVGTVSISINSVSEAQETHRRRLFGRGEAARAPRPAATPVEVGKAVEPLLSRDDAEESEAEPAEKAAEYDFDKPYVSEFQKDLAAMKAAEADEGGGEKTP